ncbi:MAG: hypothetical protein ACREP9_16725 [Candidatus Dormibacteraceae bacterium]
MSQPATPNQSSTNADFPASIPPHLAQELRKMENKPPIEVLESLLPKANLPRLLALLHGAGFPCSLPQIPEWAKNASNRFWHYYFGGRKPFGPETIPDTGMFLALVEEVSKNQAPSNEIPTLAGIQGLIPFLTQALHKEAQALPPEQAAEFYKWRAKGARAAQRISDPDFLKMQRRAPIYLALTCFWVEFEQLSSQAEAYRWLREHNTIDEGVEIREVRAALSLVGLRYRLPGRPRKSKEEFPKKPKS